MADYHHITVTFPNGNKVRGVVKGDTVPPDLARLTYLYGIKVRVGRRASDRELAQFPGVGLEPPAIPPEVKPMRPLSPDFGRGSGAPV